MDIEEYKAFTAKRGYLAAGTEEAKMMRPAAVEAQRITAQINGAFHTPEELRSLFSELIGQPVDESFALFPPVYSDFGKNIRVGKTSLSIRAAVFRIRAAWRSATAASSGIRSSLRR